MADPVKRPLTWSPKFQAYVEQHGVYDVFQDLLKEIVIWKPEDVLQYISKELPRIAKSVHRPRVFLLGPKPFAPRIGENIAGACGAVFLTFEEIIETSPVGISEHLREYLKSGDNFDEGLRKLLISVLNRRLSMADCVNNGYVLYGFPLSRAQAMAAQMGGFLPRQVFALLPRGPRGKNDELESNSSSFDEEAAPKLIKKADISIKEFEQYKDYFKIKEIISSFHLQHVKVIGYERWSVSKPSDLEAEFLGCMVTKASQGAPWIPRVVLIGPPASGKSKVAEHLAPSFNLTNVDWMDVVRGASLWQDEIAEEVKQYLADLTPLSDETVKTILKRKLLREDCVKYGWILHGFPESKSHAQLLDELGLTPNRIFLLSCPEQVSKSRMVAKRQEIINRRLPGIEYPVTIKMPGMGAKPKEHDTGEFPYSDYAIKTRYADFDSKLNAIIAHFGTEMVFVDATQSPQSVCEFVDASVRQPPNVRF